MNAPDSIRFVRIQRDMPTCWIEWLVGTQAEIAEDDAFVWVKLDTLDPKQKSVISKLPGICFRKNGPWLIREGATVAEASFPNVTWSPNSRCCELNLPPTESSIPHLKHEPIAWQLVPGGLEQPAFAALFEFDELEEWCGTTARNRIEALRACLVDDCVLVMGQPLPPLNCRYLYRRDRILLPLGTTWSPELDESWVCKSFDVSPDQWLLWIESRHWSVIDDNWLQPLSRASVRLAKQGSVS